MPRLIDANEAQEYFEKSAKCYIPAHNEYEAGKADAYTVAADYISDCKTVDAEPVIRCKDCAYRNKAKTNEKGFLICPASGMEITDNDFCSWAIKKEGKE